MNTLSEIERAVRSLTRAQRRRLLDWLAGELSLEPGVAEPVARYGGAAETHDFFSLEEYFALEERSSERHEYMAGEIVAMADPSQVHEIIAINIAAPLHAHLQDRPCRVYAGGRQLQLKSMGHDFVYRPDVWVACGQERSSKGGYVDEPCLVVEVLSPSTARFDTREKALNYREISTIQEYLLVGQKPAHLVIYRRAEQWRPQLLESLGDVLDLQSVGLSLPVAHIYKGVPEDAGS
ncbi:MAG TPA: Uma2 family endonuclease [Steroidobacteraceae bacterium]|nr:Uma2 family endonuclease [Steroidobacteraceae bacterium]